MSNKTNYNNKMPKLIEKHSITIGLVTLATIFMFVTGFAYKVGGAEREIRDSVNDNAKKNTQQDKRIDSHIAETRAEREKHQEWKAGVNKKLTIIIQKLDRIESENKEIRR